jgi:hypothetical protein
VQDLIDKGQTVLVENRNLVQRMESSVGIPFTSEDDDAFTNFKQVIVFVFILIFLYSLNDNILYLNVCSLICLFCGWHFIVPLLIHVCIMIHLLFLLFDFVHVI